MGNIVSAIIASKMRKDLDGYEEDIEKGNFESIRKWLRLKIHTNGELFIPPKCFLVIP
ncbi:MAG TPA: hypothetical protein VFV86_13435 [Nitrososphaeraceae archaeon]|nr:hypothetical protein [Nitrososphaeraceae archaeon]